MGQYLRDEFLKNLSITSDNLQQLGDMFLKRFDELLAESIESKDEGDQPILDMIIRFDNKGIKVRDSQELIKYFKQASKVERVVFSLETKSSRASNRNSGRALDVRLDANDPNGCVLIVSADDSDWVEACFSDVKEVLGKLNTYNGWARTSLTQVFVQILGVVIGFLLSYWVARYVASRAAVENAFFLTFIFSILIYSNIWTYFNQVVIKGVARLFPNIEFYRPRKEPVHWLVQQILGWAILGLVVSVTLGIFGFFTGVVREFLSGGLGY